MAEGPPPAKRGRRTTPVLRVTAEERVKQFPEDLYSDDGVLFCKFCDHSVDYVRIDTIKDHMKSKKHTQRKDQKEAGSSATTHHQVTLTSMARSRDLREEFVIDFLKMATMADIPLEKVEKMKPFLLKYLIIDRIFHPLLINLAEISLFNFLTSIININQSFQLI